MQAHETYQSVIDTCIELSWRGYLASTVGDLALRIDSDHFAVTPSVEMGLHTVVLRHVLA